MGTNRSNLRSKGLCLDGMRRKHTDNPTREVFEAAKSGDAVLLNEVLQEMDSGERASALETKMAASVLEGEIDVGPIIGTAIGTYNTTPLIVSVENGNLDCVKVLLKYKVDIEGRGDDFAWYHNLDEDLKYPDYFKSFTPLFVAAAKGNLDILSCLIENGADVNSRTDKRTPLMIAIDKGHLDVVTFLIEHGANLELQDSDGRTALLHAVFSGSCDVLSCLIKNGANVNVRARDSCTPLMIAVKKDQVDVVTFLIEHGANMTLIDKHGCTALHYATSKKVLSCLVRNGADVNACTSDNYTPLMKAVEGRNKIAVTFLLEHGTDMDVKTFVGGKKALHLAVSHDRGSCNILNCLLKNGVDVNSRTSMGITPLMLASKCGHVNTVTFLIKYGADVDLKDPTGQTALHYAVYQQQDSCDVLKCLIKHGADINARTNKNCTPLMIASKNGHVNKATILVKRGANMDLQDKNGETALHYAVSAKFPEVTNKLVTLGASLQLCNKRRLTPLLLASDECKISIVEELIKRPECTKEQRIDALELLGASLVSSTEKNTARIHEATRKGFQYIKRGMEERFEDPSHPLFKKPMEQVKAFQNGRESQTLEDLSWIEGDIDAIILESLMIRERILGRDNVELLFVIRKITQCQVHHQLDRDLPIALYRYAIKIAQSCNQSAISDLDELTSLLYSRVWRNVPSKQEHILELLEQTVLEYEKQQKLRKGIENEPYEFKTSRDFQLCSLFGSTVKLLQIIAKLKYSEVSCVSLLLKRLCLLNPRDRHGDTLLHSFIVHHGTVAFPFINTVKLLLNAGFNVNAVNNKGDTLLHIAVTFVPQSIDKIHFLTDLLEVLLDGGAHYDFVNNDGKTAMDLAKTDEARRILSEKRKLELKCISARAVKKFGLPYLGVVPSTVEKYISMH